MATGKDGLMGVLKHGHARRIDGERRVDSPEYRAFAAMKNRCLNRRQARWKDYGGRGITICDRWLHGEGAASGFECFLADLGPKPTPHHSVDRIDNGGNYEPSNVRWALRSDQGRNTRASRIVNVAGLSMCLIEAIEMFPFAPNGTVRQRTSRGWGDEEAVLTPKGAPRLSDYPVPF